MDGQGNDNVPAHDTAARVAEVGDMDISSSSLICNSNSPSFLILSRLLVHLE
jgi:hypothetical protein